MVPSLLNHLHISSSVHAFGKPPTNTLSLFASSLRHLIHGVPKTTSLNCHHIHQHCDVEHFRTHRHWNRILLCWTLQACFIGHVAQHRQLVSILRHLMHLIVQGSINHPSVLQHKLCFLLEGFNFLLSQMVTVLKTDLYLHTQRLECSIVGSCASSAAHRCSSIMATASDTFFLCSRCCR